jgi:hypothetical protein
MITIIPNLPIFAYAFSTGFALLAAVVVRIFLRDKTLVSGKIMPITFMFLYTVVFYCAFFRIFITRYYYETRYLVPYIPVIIVMGAVSIEKLKVRYKAIIAVVSAVLLLPFSSALAVNKDFYRMELPAYSKIIETVRMLESGSVIVIDTELSASIFNEISLTSDHYAFPHSLFSHLYDLSFVEGRNVYFVASRGQNAPSDTFFDKAEKISTISYSKSNFNWWMTGWRPGPLTLLNRNNSYEMQADIFDLTKMFNSGNGITYAPISWQPTHEKEVVQ